MFTKHLATLAGALMILTLAPTAFAQDFAINWYTIDGGGGTSTGGDFSVSGTIGQYDAGVMTGGEFAITGGLWGGTDAGVTCVGDLNGDGEVGLPDLAIILANFGTPSGASYEDGDLDGDGDVDLQDLAELLAAFGTICS